MSRSAYAVLLALGLLSAPPAATAAPRWALWQVVRACELDARVTGSAWPCLAVDRAGGFVLIADPRRRTQLVLAPTARVTGIESSRLQAGGGPNYWRAAWDARTRLDRRAGRPVPAEAVGLAVNSAPGRTQDQLHIHIDCLRASVRRAIDADVGRLDDGWADLPTPLVRGHRYRARWLAGDALRADDPFRLLAADPVVRGDLGAWTLVMTAARRPSGERGFVLLSHRADLLSYDLAAGEELLDHRCALLQAGAAAP